MSAWLIFGDGAANQGQVYEAFNMASLWELPVIYVIENNMYAMGTSVERHASETELYKRGISFEIAGEEVDGMDVYAVKKAGEKAGQTCAQRKRPIYPRNEDLSLSRPLHVRPSEISKTRRGR